MELSNPLISDYTWANKPSVAPSGQIICITDIGENGSLWRGNGTKWVRLHSIKFYDLPAAVSLTGTTTETTLATVTIPAGLLGSNGKIIVYPLWTMTNSAGQKNFKLKLGGQPCYQVGLTTSAHSASLLLVRNFNSVSAQKTSSGLSAGLGVTTATISNTTVNTAIAQDLTITGQLANGTDTMTLEGFFVEIA